MGLARRISALFQENTEHATEEAFFSCRKCFAKTKTVYTYESAEESDFVCSCGGSLSLSEGQ